MSDRVIVTIGLCMKNAKRLIGVAINSVLIQDLSHRLTEIVVIKRQNEDRTHAIVESKLREANIAHKILFENSGLGKARQIIMDLALAEAIAKIFNDNFT